ncbi:ethanolamine ammonia-lyase subunit EutC [Rugamonas sp.]|uniref:ethanolamine ammonia-lyase subunit EutC n=1 Tax=Rugamonas sp. TaxID=1926287 RepID=UPI0025FA632A|nr:ethanolamine ammonia-lyase subunit EutC [Rugamonas sp.]
MSGATSSVTTGGSDEGDDAGDRWQALRRLTQARIALGRTGVSAPTGAQLAFQLAHAQARDAVHAQLDVEALSASLRALGQDCVTVHSAAADRQMYLQRPDLGRQLDDASRAALSARPRQGADLALVIADGLSARAIAQNAAPFLRLLLARLAAEQWTLAPLTIASQGRVAIGDDIGALLKARAVLVLIGERPGLSSPDSMGLYLSWAPRVGLTDADRNCISNVRPAGLQYAAAVDKLAYLLTEARRRGLSGVALKEEAPDGGAPAIARAPNFLLG